MADGSYHHDMARRGWAEGSIYRTRSGRYRVAVSLGRDPFGKRLRKEWQCRTSAAAERKLREVRARLGGGLPVEDSRVTVVAYAEEWLDGVKPSVKPSTYSFYATLARLHLAEVAHLPLTHVGPAEIRRLIAKRQDEGYSSRTIRGIVDVLRMILKQAMGDGIITRNVAELVTLPKLEQAEPQHLSAIDARRLLAAARDDPLYSLYAVALGTGLRVGELVALTWQDVDLDTGLITVRKSKTKAGQRSLPLPTFALQALKVESTLWTKARRIGPIWATDRWTPGKRLSRICASAGIPRIGMHGLRHSTASLLFAEGVPDFVVQSILGHSRVGMTKHYTHIEIAQQRDAMDRLGRAIG